MDNFAPDRVEQWTTDTIKTITFLQFQMSRLQETEDNETTRERYGHALACLLKHFKCRTGVRAPAQTTNAESAAEYGRLINMERNARPECVDAEAQTVEQEVSLLSV